jgi:hypothetical protein
MEIIEVASPAISLKSPSLPPNLKRTQTNYKRKLLEQINFIESHENQIKQTKTCEERLQSKKKTFITRFRILRGVF